MVRNRLTTTFDGIDRPLQSYTRALAASGFVIEQLREPQPSEADLQRAQELAPAARKPYFIHLCCRLSSNPS